MFNIIYYKPIGYRIPYYVNEFCGICRGKLAANCVNCDDAEFCVVDENKKYHSHCLILANKHSIKK